MKSLFVGSVALLAGAAVSHAEETSADACQALVQKGACVHAEALDDARSDRIALLSGIEGRVMTSGDAGFTPVRTEASLFAGDRALVLEGGKATIEAGSYSQTLSSPAMIDASAVDGCGCLMVESDVRAFSQAEGFGALTGLSTKVAVVGGAVAVGALAVGIAASVSDSSDDTPTSP